MKIMAKIFLFLLCSLLMILLSCSRENSQKDNPNIIVILIDDLGYGDIGSYNDTIDFTPNIDRLAREGMRFTDFHSNGPMCSPTRAAMLTGMYHHRLGERFEGALSAKKKDKGFSPDIRTVAEMFKQMDYATGLFGKWHLGIEEPYIPNNYGFDEFSGLLSGDGDHHTHINRWGMEDWWYNEQLRMEEGYSVDLITEHSTRFIQKHKDRPFFLLISHLAIHFPWQGPDDPPQRVAGGNYENDKWGIIENPGNVRPHVIHMIEAVDKSVGEIIEKLNEYNLRKNTIVLFTSDNGGYTHYYQNDNKFENISDNGPLRGQKTEVYEGGHRVPLIITWPGKITAGTVSDETVMSMDFYPTFAELIGADMPENQMTDGISISPLLFEEESLPERTLFWKIGEDWAVRKGPWKLVNTGNKKQLFHLSNDVGEETDMSVENPDIVQEYTLQFRKWQKEISSFADKWSD